MQDVNRKRPCEEPVDKAPVEPDFTLCYCESSGCALPLGPSFESDVLDLPVGGQWREGAVSIR